MNALNKAKPEHRASAPKKKPITPAGVAKPAPKIRPGVRGNRKRKVPMPLWRGEQGLAWIRSAEDEMQRLNFILITLLHMQPFRQTDRELTKADVEPYLDATQSMMLRLADFRTKLRSEVRVLKKLAERVGA